MVDLGSEGDERREGKGREGKMSGVEGRGLGGRWVCLGRVVLDVMWGREVGG